MKVMVRALTIALLLCATTAFATSNVTIIGFSNASMKGIFAVNGEAHSSFSYLLSDVGLWTFDGAGKITGTHECYIQDQLGAKTPASPDLCEVTIGGTYSVASDGLASMSVTFTIKSGPATCGTVGSKATISGEFVIEDSDHAHAI